MVEDRPLLRPEVGTAVITGVTSPCRMLVESSLSAPPALRLREPCLKQELQAGIVIRKRLVEVQDGEAWTFHGVGGKMPLAYSSCS